MSRLTDLLRELRSREPALARDLEQEVAALADRRAFGLNFERHVPEAVELPGRKIRKGDKVRVLPPRGQVPTKVDERLWRVVGIERSAGTAGLKSLAAPTADSEEQIIGVVEAHPETRSASLHDLVVVAEFRDPIYPGLVVTGKVERGGDKPFHAVINAENFHALETLLFTHRGKCDCIYIDPPYNSGAKDWKYNNDYIESDDLYRHSKWLAMMERRLNVAKELLNPTDSVLIVTIDEKEYLRLGLLLEQTFEGSSIAMVSSVINPKGTGRSGDFARTNEYLFFVRFGSATVGARLDGSASGVEVAWETMRRRNLASIRGRKGKGACGPNQFYAIFVDASTGAIVGRGSPIAPNVKRQSINAPVGAVAVFPVRSDGTEMNWEYADSAFDIWWPKGYIRANGPRDEPQAYVIQHLPNKARKEIESGVLVVDSKRNDGSVVAKYVGATTKTVTTQWDFTSHSAEHGGTRVLKALLPGRRFPYPKSLYAVEDALRFFIQDKRQAVVLDFFAGSGTTAHAVLRLNRQDDGRRQCISVTNNEVAAEEQRALRTQGLRPGDADWEKLGICEYISKPRIEAAVTGNTPGGEPIDGDYKFVDEFPMADGFEENVEFFTLTYEAPLRIASNREFVKIAPLLWLRAGSCGRRIDDISSGWDVADIYGVLADLDCTEDYLLAIAANKKVRVAYVITDEDRLFESMAQELPDHVEPVRLYEAYLRNFEIESGRGSL